MTVCTVSKDVISTFKASNLRDFNQNPEYFGQRMVEIYDSWKEEQIFLDTFVEKQIAQLGLESFAIKGLISQVYYLLKIQSECKIQNNINVDLNDLCFTITTGDK